MWLEFHTRKKNPKNTQAGFQIHKFRVTALLIGRERRQIRIDRETILDVFLTEPDMSDNEPADADLSGGGNQIPKLRNMPQEKDPRTRFLTDQIRIGQIEPPVDPC